MVNRSNELLTVRNLSKSYDGRKLAVDNISFEVKPGEVFGFLGPNGAGKSTTLKLVTGILQADQGEIFVNGFNLADQAMDAKRQFAFVPDNPDVLLRLTGLEYLRFMGDIYDVPEDLRRERVSDLSVAFEMDSVLGDTMQTYSHGMRQKMVVMGALLHDPPLWLLDEPMTGLDPRSSFLLKERIDAHAAKGHAVLFSTHVLDVAERMVDRLAIIDDGVIKFIGSLEELRSNLQSDGSLEQLFLQLTEESPEFTAALNKEARNA